MSVSKKIGLTVVLASICCLATNNVQAQPEIGGSIPNYRNMTLDFDNMTSTNVVQTVTEIGTNNEKEVEFGDWDNDGDVDAVLAVGFSDFTQRRNKLYRNNNGVMNEVSNLIANFSLTDVSRSAFLRDYDNDGMLDIVIINDPNTSGNGGESKYFRNVNNGTSWVMENTRLSQVQTTGAACSASSVDFDEDGWIDIYKCDYPNSSQDLLIFNNKNGSGPGWFVNFTTTHAPSEQNYGVNSEVADMNGDGQIDILLANWSGTSSFIYYNNNMNLGGATGDFRYTGTGQFTSFSQVGGSAEIAMVPGDFDNDGDQDFYYANKGGFSSNRTDVIMTNTGNDVNNRAIFTETPMPAAVNNAAHETNKVTVSDLNGDGRLDLVVMSKDRRPYVYRNTTPDGGAINFTEWTPPSILGDTSLRGWHANTADLLGDSGLDIFVGGYVNDHLFENVASIEYDESDLTGGALPAFHNVAPIALTGTASSGQTDVFTTSIAAGATVSAILNSYGDVTLVVKQSNGTVIATSERGLNQTDEVAQFTAPGGGLEFHVTLNRSAYDGDGDGDVDQADNTRMIAVIADNNVATAEEMAAFDLSHNGTVTGFDRLWLRNRFSGTDVPSSDEYVLELNSRPN